MTHDPNLWRKRNEGEHQRAVAQGRGDRLAVARIDDQLAGLGLRIARQQREDRDARAAQSNKPSVQR